MKTLPPLCYFLAISIIYSSTAKAEESSLLPLIEVESPASESLNKTASTTHLGEDDLLRSGQRELTQVLRAIPGLTTTQGMKGGTNGLGLRGSTAGVGLVNIDGIPLHDTQPNALSLDLFPAETFGGVDIVRGSAAMLNFGRSLGGNINLHSRDSGKSGAGLHLEGGSFGSLRETAYADWANVDHSLNLTAGRDDLFDGSHYGDPKRGNSERDDAHAHQLAMHLRNRLGERADLDSSVYYVNSDRGVDKLGLIRFPPPELAIVDDPGRSQQEIWLAQSTAGIDLHPKWRSELQLGYTEHRVNIHIGGILPGSPQYPIAFNNQLSLARWKNSHHLEIDGQIKRSVQFSWGGEGLYEQGRSITGDGGQRGTGSGFANLQGNWDDWQATLAVRADHFDDYGSHAVYHAGLSWQMTSHWQGYVNGGSGYRAPSFNEMLMWPFGNSQLKPEQSAGGEVGLRWKPDEHTQFSANYFNTGYEGLIRVERTAVPLGQYLINNIPHASIQGVESQWQTRWDERFSTGIDYTWTDGKNSDTGKLLPRQPQHVARFWGEWAWQTLPLKLWTQGIYRGNSFDTGGTAEIGDSFTLDMQLNYQAAKSFAIYLRGENLSDNHQPQVIGWGMPGASVYGGFRWTIF